MFIEKVPTTDPASPFMGERLFGCAPKWSFTDFNSGSCSINISPLRGFSDRLWQRELRTNSWRTVLVSCLPPPASCLLHTGFRFLPFRSQVRKQDYIANRMLVGQQHY